MDWSVEYGTLPVCYKRRRGFRDKNKKKNTTATYSFLYNSYSCKHKQQDVVPLKGILFEDEYKVSYFAIFHTVRVGISHWQCNYYCILICFIQKCFDLLKNALYIHNRTKNLSHFFSKSF